MVFGKIGASPREISFFSVLFEEKLFLAEFHIQPLRGWMFIVYTRTLWLFCSPIIIFLFLRHPVNFLFFLVVSNIFEKASKVSWECLHLESAYTCPVGLLAKSSCLCEGEGEGEGWRRNNRFLASLTSTSDALLCTQAIGKSGNKRVNDFWRSQIWSIGLVSFL